MEEYNLLSPDEKRNVLEEERAKFADQQKLLLEMKSKINRGKLGNASRVTEKTLGEFLQTCCVETEKEQLYVSTVIERVKGSANTTKNVLESVNGHAQELLNNISSDVVELTTNLERIKSDHSTLSSVLENRESRGRDLRERQKNALQASTNQVDRSEQVFNEILARINAQILQVESEVAERTELARISEIEMLEAERDADLAEAALNSYLEESQAVDEQLQKAQADFDKLQSKLSITKRAMECAESDQASLETEVTELRDSTKQLGILISVKLKNIEESEAQVSELSTSLDGLTAQVCAAESEISQLEKANLDEQQAAKISYTEVVQALESEVETASRQLSADSIKADVMDKMFGIDGERTPEEWTALIDLRKAVGSSNKEILDRRNALISELETAKNELEQAEKEAKAALDDQSNAQSRVLITKKRAQDDLKSIETNMQLIESRIVQAQKELELLTNAKCAEAFATPARHSSLQSVQGAPKVRRTLSGDSDAESVSKTIFDLPNGIVKRTDIVSHEASPIEHPEDDAAKGGSAIATQPIADVVDKINSPAESLNASANQISPFSGTTAEMMFERENILALNETDLTMDMDEDDMNLSMMDMPPAQSVKTLSPPPVRPSISKTSIIVSDFDSDPDASVWGEDF